MTTVSPRDTPGEEAPRVAANVLGTISRVLAVTLSVFEIWAVLFSTLDPYLHRALFTTSILGLGFLAAASSAPTAGSRAGNATWAVVSLASGAYVLLQFGWLSYRWPLVYPLTPIEVVVALVIIAAVFELTRRMVGLAMCAAIAAFLVYALGGHVLDGLLHHRPLTIAELLDHLVFTNNGIFGAPIAVASTYVFFFVLFGTALELSGGGQLFFGLAWAVAGRARGGPAKVAVVSSALYGTVTGSPTANVVTCGTFTIPLMRRAGLPAVRAAAIEAVASTGGSLMPPVMGSAAFLMAEITGIRYRDIAIAAAVPAVLYYLGIFFQVHFQAGRTAGRTEVPAGMDVTVREVLRKHGLQLVPLAALIVLLARQATPIYAASVALVLTIAASWVRRETRMGPAALLKMLELAGFRTVLVAVACAAAGILVGAIAATGFAGKITSLIVASSGGSLFVALVLTMTVCIVLGMGMPVPSAYLLTAVLAAPPLAALGITTMSAHMFIMYFAVLSAITPPVAVAAYAAAGIAQVNPNSVGLESVRIGLVAFIVPYFFVYEPALLLVGSPWAVAGALLSATIGVAFVAGALEGYVRAPLGWAARAALMIGGLCLVFPGWRSDLLGAVVGLLALRSQLRPPSESRNLQFRSK